MPRNYESSKNAEAPWPRNTERRPRPSEEVIRDYRHEQSDKWERRESERLSEPTPPPTPPPSPSSSPPDSDESPELELLVPAALGYRPPRIDPICSDPPPGPWDPYGSSEILPDYITVSALTSLAEPDEIWLYGSGGGLRSPHGTLGTAWYLDYIDHWRYVTRIVSVSGGAIANAEFAAQARAKATSTGANPNGAGRPTEFVADFYRRLSTQHRWILALLVVVMAFLTVGVTYLLWRTPEVAQWLTARQTFRAACAAVAGILLVYLLWTVWQRSAPLLIACLLTLAAAVAAAWGVTRLWPTLPAAVRWVVIVVAIAVFLLALWRLTGSAFAHWFVVLLTTVAGAVLLAFLLHQPQVRDNWRWLAWTVTSVLLLLCVWLYLVALQYGIHRMLRYRIAKMLDQVANPPPETLEQVDTGLAHIFATADYRSGHPLYLTAGPVDPAPVNPAAAGVRAAAVHDLSTSLNAIHYYDAATIGLRNTVYDSAALPGLVWPRRRTMGALAQQHRPHIEPQLGRWFYGKGQMSPGGDGLPQPLLRSFTPLDGGLNSTLGTRLDPLLAGLIDERGTMEAFDQLHPPANPFPAVANLDVRRVVVDAGQYLDETPAHLTRLSTWIGVSALLTLKRGINIANLSLLESDRQLTERPGTDIWYIPTTGGDRTFRLKFTIKAVNDLAAQGRADPVASGSDPLRTLLLEQGRLAWFDGLVPASVLDIAQTIDRLLLLKERTDRLSLTNGQTEYGYDALASGVASTLVEHRGIDNDLQPLEKCLFDLDAQLLDDELQQKVLFGTNLPLAISHQGLRPAGQRGNTATAFLNALNAGFTMLEVDVMLTNDKTLVAVHPIKDPAQVPGVNVAVSTRSVSNTDLVDLQVQVSQLAQLRHLLDPTNHANDLFPNDKAAVANAATLAGAIWNIEAKDKNTAAAVAELLNELNDRGHTAHPPQVFFSGGWLIRSLRTFRSIDRHQIGTACHWWEALRLALGFNAATPLLMQVPVIEPAAWWARPFVIRLLQRAIRQGRARGKAIVWFTVNHADEVIKLRSLDPCHGVMTEGAHVLFWSDYNFWRAPGGQAP